MVFDKFVNALENEVASDQLLTSPEALIAYSMDATRNTSLPKAVFFAKDSKQLQEVMRLCSEFNIAVTPRGSGTGLSGGAVPEEGGLVVSFTKMKEIQEIDDINLVAVVEPGVITGQLQNEVLKQKLFYPPDPSSASVSTIGGNLACGAGGPRALKYGVTRDYVLGLEVVLSDGTLINTGGPTYKNVSGFDLTRLLVASEGSLGLITKATLKLIPAPLESLSYLVAFKTLAAASKAVVEVVKSGLLPTALEIMDKVTVNAVNRHSDIGIPPKTDALLLIEIDGLDVSKQELLLDKVLTKLKPLAIDKAKDKAEAGKIWAARKAALPALSRIAPSILLEDATVPRKELPALIQGIQEIARKNNLTIGCFGHAGDGNLHPTIITDLRQKEKARDAKKAIDGIFKLALKLGGTLTGEHGIGLVKKGYLKSEIGQESKDIMKNIKRVFDKQEILNTSKIFEES